MPMRSLSPWSGGIEEFINEFDRGLIPAPLLRARADFTPALDMRETDEAYLLCVDLPGMKKSEIRLDIAENVLTIAGERRREATGEGRYSERSFGQFERTVGFPANVNAEKIEAHFTDGVLEITVPKSESARTHSIKIM